MAGLFRSPRMPTVATEPITEDDPKVKEAERVEAERLRKRRGMASTIMTGPQGVLGTPDLLRAELG